MMKQILIGIEVGVYDGNVGLSQRDMVQLFDCRTKYITASKKYI